MNKSGRKNEKDAWSKSLKKTLSLKKLKQEEQDTEAKEKNQKELEKILRPWKQNQKKTRGEKN